ncbi:hypothetical protein AGR4B_pAt20500 [Agrobacterium tumefaciens str. CFBP 5621]|nr:hypothetical protein AGR4B_pAt20500 [Agrobacterium tumefaciens str. CFBP 5621]
MWGWERFNCSDPDAGTVTDFAIVRWRTATKRLARHLPIVKGWKNGQARCEWSLRRQIE